MPPNKELEPIANEVMSSLLKILMFIIIQETAKPVAELWTDGFTTIKKDQ